MRISALLASLKNQMAGGSAAPGLGELQAKYKLFQKLVETNTLALEAVSDLQSKASGDYLFDRVYLEGAVRKALSLSRESSSLLQGITDGRYGALLKAQARLEEAAEAALAASAEKPSGPVVIDLSKARLYPDALCGAKMRRLSEIASGAGLDVPDGFCVTSAACFEFLEHAGLLQAAAGVVEGLSVFDKTALEEASLAIRGRIMAAQWPAPLAKEVLSAFARLEERLGRAATVSVRSSASGEDGTFSFAGQFGTVLNVGRGGLLKACSEVAASQFSPRALLYYKSHGIRSGFSPMAIGVISMIDARTSGVLYTKDPDAPGSGVMAVAARWGLGAPTVDGSKTPDLFAIDSKSGELANSRVARKETMLLCREGAGLSEVAVPGWMRESPSLTSDELRQLAECGSRLERFFNCPQDAEWAFDPEGRLRILQSRPLRTARRDASASGVAAARRGLTPLIREGVIASRGCASGKVFILEDEERMAQVPEKAILVARAASPRIAEAIGRVAGIICETGSSASHLGTVAREFCVPALFNVPSASALLKDGSVVTLDAEMGHVYEGLVSGILHAERDAAKKDDSAESPLLMRARRLAAMLAALNLTDPKGPAFKPSRCKSLNDILRFAHEKAVEEIFLAGGRVGLRGGKARRLASRLPLDLRMVDIGGGLSAPKDEDCVHPDEFLCRPLIALWKGMEEAPWSTSAAASGGQIASLLMTAMTSARTAEEASSPNYAVVSSEAMSFGFRLGYHFSRVDARLGDEARLNYATFIFQGGAASAAGKARRVELISRVAETSGFKVAAKGDALFARTENDAPPEMERKLAVLGRLLVATRQADTILRCDGDVEAAVAAHAAGDPSFGLQPKERP